MTPCARPARRQVLRFALALAVASSAQAPLAAVQDCADGRVPDLARAVREAGPSVVRIVSIHWRRGEPRPLRGGDTPGERQATPWFADRSSSSGFVIDGTGEVVSSAHAVRRAAETWVLAADGRQWRATVVGLDMRLDVAVLRVDGSDLPPLRLATVEPLRGQWVAAIGAPFGFDQSVTAGVVSAFPRELPGRGGVPLIQSDVVLNPGSSGGPLLDECGQVVGLNSLIFSATGLYLGVSFSVPAARLASAVDSITSGRQALVEPGLHMQSVTPSLQRSFGLGARTGAIVTGLDAGSAAARSGLRIGDVIVAVGGREARSADSVWQMLQDTPGAGPDLLQVWRGGQAIELALQRRPAGPAQPVEAPRTPPVTRLGLQLGVLPKGEDGTGTVHVLAAAGAALLAGLEEGDRVLAVNGMPIVQLDDFDRALEIVRRAGADSLAVLVDRDGARFYLPVAMRDAPALR